MAFFLVHGGTKRLTIDHVGEINNVPRQKIIIGTFGAVVVSEGDFFFES